MEIVNWQQNPEIDWDTKLEDAKTDNLIGVRGGSAGKWCGQHIHCPLP